MTGYPDLQLLDACVWVPGDGPLDLTCDDVTAKLTDLEPLNASCQINLKELKTETEDLWLNYYIHDPLRELTTTPDQMLWAYLPMFMYDLMDYFNIPDDLLGKHEALDHDEVTSIPGNFWNSSWLNHNSYYAAAVNLALMTAMTYADYAEEPEQAVQSCNFAGSYFRLWADLPMFEYHFGDLDQIINCSALDPAASVSIMDGAIAWASLYDWWSPGGSGNATTPWGWYEPTAQRVNLCNVNRVSAALADYYFMWAHKLFDYAETKALSTDEKDHVHAVGMYAARAALSEISAISALMLHEFAHIVGSWYHCQGDWFALNFANYSCCQYLLERSFMTGFWARQGLHPNTYLWYAKQRRYEYQLGVGGVKYPLDRKVRKCEWTYDATHVDPYALNHAASVVWAVNEKCWSDECDPCSGTLSFS